MTMVTRLDNLASQLAGQLVVAAVIGAASGAVGAFILLRRMALVGDALSHVALPGIAIALAYRVDPFWGVVTTLLIAAPFVWWLERRSNLPTDALVGILFTTSLAIGILTIPDTEILESLFGAFPALSPLAFAGTIIAAVIAVSCTFLLTRPFLYRLVSGELAQSAGVGSGYDLLLLVIFATIVALGIKLVGTLLMGALTIIPAAIARNLASGMRSYIVAASGIGAAVSVIGAFLANMAEIRPGPMIILLGVAIFLLSLPAAKRGK